MPNSLREKLDAAFESLTQAGFLARQNFMCCSGCAGCALANEAEKLVDAGTSPNGAVFFHQQDAEVLDWFAPEEDDYNPDDDEEDYLYQRRHVRGNSPSRFRSRKGILSIRYTNLDTQKHGIVGLPQAEIGKIVCETFNRVGISYTWDGDPDSCIEVEVD